MCWISSRAFNWVYATLSTSPARFLEAVIVNFLSLLCNCLLSNEICLFVDTNQSWDLSHVDNHHDSFKHCAFSVRSWLDHCCRGFDHAFLYRTFFFIAKSPHSRLTLHQYFACSIFCNIYLHLLLRFPGLKSLAASRLPFVLAMRNGGLVHRVQKLHEEYGSVVRLAPNEVSFINAKACRDIYAYRPGHRPFPKTQVWVPTPPTKWWQGTLDLSANDGDHAKTRRA